MLSALPFLANEDHELLFANHVKARYKTRGLYERNQFTEEFLLLISMIP